MRKQKLKGRGSWRKLYHCRFRGESLSRPHPPIIFYLFGSQQWFSGLVSCKLPTRIQLHLCPTTVLMFQWLFSKVGFAEGVTWSTFHLNLEGLASGCSPTHGWFFEFLTVFVWILHWTIFLQPLGGIKVEPDVSTPKLSLTTFLLSLWYSTTTLGTSKNKKQS